MSEHHTDSFIGTLVPNDHVVLARRYVDALYGLAEQEDMIDVVVADLRSLRRVWAESAEWRAIAFDPRLSNEALIHAASHVSSMCDVGDLAANFLSVVAQNRRLSVLPAMIECFLDLVADKRGEFRADVRTARPLTDAQRTALAAQLNAAAGGKVHLTVTEDADLLGGLTVKMGSKFIDASVRNRLETLERTLKGAA